MGILILIIVVIVIGVSVYNSDREKQERLESQAQREREERERREKEEVKKKIETEKAKRIVETENFKKLYNYINNENLKKKGNAVYECYPYNSFSICESGITSMYFILTFTPFKIDIKWANVEFSDIGIPNIKSDEIGAFSCAFGLKPGYIYNSEMQKVLIDKSYWNASKSVEDIEAIYNGN